MKNEVEEFLRRVAQMRAQAEAQAKGQQQERAQKSQARPPQQPARQQPPTQQPYSAPAPPRTIAKPLQQVEIVDAELADRSDRVSRQVTEDLRGTQQISEHTRRLGAEVDSADEKMEAHLHQIFDHKLGQLKSSTSEAAVLQTDKAAAELSLTQIVQMLRSPSSIRDAVIMAEILKRPNF
jgi:hypothetical protein